MGIARRSSPSPKIFAAHSFHNYSFDINHNKNTLIIWYIYHIINETAKTPYKQIKIAKKYKLAYERKE